MPGRFIASRASPDAIVVVGRLGGRLQVSDQSPWKAEGVGELEAGVDVADQLLKRYDPVQCCWSLPKTGEFWEIVTDGHRNGHDGNGVTVAVVDGGFDTTISALSRFPVRGVDPGHTSHGSAVALLVREVAPAAQLRLFTATRQGKLDAALVASAIRHAVDAGAQVINLSLGWRVPLSEEVLRDLSPSQLVDWRERLRLPEHSVTEAVAEAVAQGALVVAACGNNSESVLIPAAMNDALAVGFLTVWDLGDGELTGLSPNGYSQSRYADVRLVQPADVLGSSFACPLVAGFAAISPHREILRSYVRPIAIAAIASDLMIGWSSSAWNDRAEVIDEWFKRSLRDLPHIHLPATGPCLTCGLLAAPAYINWGLWKLRWGDLDGAEELFRAVTVFAPSNRIAERNLAQTLAAREAS